MAYTGYPTAGWYGNGNGGYAYFRFAVESTYDPSGGTYGETTVNVKLQVKLTGNATYCWPYILGEGSLTYGGTSFSFPSSGYSIPTPNKDTWYDVKYNGSSKVWSKTVAHDANGAASITLSLNNLRLLYSSDQLYYISLGGTYSVTVDLSQDRTYKLTINAGTGSTISVTRGGIALANNATITYGDVLTVTYGASSGYTLATHTLNGSTFTSGNTHTVTGNVAVAATATVTPATYTLTIDKDTYSTVTVKKGSTTLSNGASITAGDTLTILFGTAAGYTLTQHTVNGADFESGENHTVSGNVTVKARSTANATGGGVWLYANGAWAEYQAYIYNNGAWEKYAPYIYTSDGWVKY